MQYNMKTYEMNANHSIRDRMIKFDTLFFIGSIGMGP